MSLASFHAASFGFTARANWKRPARAMCFQLFRVANDIAYLRPAKKRPDAAAGST